jgi:hypothetical protein
LALGLWKVGAQGGLPKRSTRLLRLVLAGALTRLTRGPLLRRWPGWASGLLLSGVHGSTSEGTGRLGCQGPAHRVESRPGGQHTHGARPGLPALSTAKGPKVQQGALDTTSSRHHHKAWFTASQHHKEPTRRTQACWLPHSTTNGPPGQQGGRHTSGSQPHHKAWLAASQHHKSPARKRLPATPQCLGGCLAAPRRAPQVGTKGCTQVAPSHTAKLGWRPRNTPKSLHDGCVGTIPG